MTDIYNPAPIDSSDIVLPSDLTTLVEKLSENVHEIWAAERLKDGWTYGEVRDDLKKQNPCIVSYVYLDEQEKKYDREIVIGILKAVFKLGYEISPKNTNE